MTTEPGPLCRVCGGTGLVAPSPFFGDVVGWPAHLERAAGLLRRGYPWESSATATWLTRPLPCPACGGVRAVPEPVLVRLEILGPVSEVPPDPVPEPEPAPPPAKAGKRELAEQMRLQILREGGASWA